MLAAFTLPVQVPTLGLSALSQAKYTAISSYFIIRADTSHPPGMTTPQWGLGCCQGAVSLLLWSSQILPSLMRRGSVQGPAFFYQMLWVFLTHTQLCCSPLDVPLNAIISGLLTELWFCINAWKLHSMLKGADTAGLSRSHCSRQCLSRK